jgi:hypothetical protein
VRRAYVGSTWVLALLLLLVGGAMVVTTLARGGGVLAFGVVFGVALAVAGAGRLWLAARSGS